MQFLRRHQFLLFFLAVLVLACVLVIRQYLANQSAHVETREDFIFLMERGESRPAGHLYQVLIQQLPDLNEKSLVDDLERMSLLTNSQSADSENLLFKYNASVKKELDQHSEQRIKRALEQAEKK